MLANIQTANPDDVAEVELHCASGYPLFSSEASSRAGWYAAKYYGDTYIDGAYGGGSSTSSSWSSKVNARRVKSSPIAESLWGDLDPTTRKGKIYAKFLNETSSTISGKIYFLIVEDNIDYSAPNGDKVHNNVARKYLPNTVGSSATIIAHDSVIQNRSFTLGASWNVDNCKIYAWIQQPDDPKEVYQTGKIYVSDLPLPIAIDEYTNETIASKLTVTPNPCNKNAHFIFTVPAGSPYSIRVYDITGSQLKEIRGLSGNGAETITWDCRDNAGTPVGSGVYFYLFTSNAFNTSGKIIVQ